MAGAAGHGASAATRRAAASVVLGLYEAWRNEFDSRGPPGLSAWAWLDEAMGLTGLGTLSIAEGFAESTDRVIAASGAIPQGELAR